MPHRLRLLALSLAASSAALAGATQAQAASASPTARAAAVTACPAAAAQPQDASLDTLEDTVLCLVNRERTSRGLVRLRTNSRLATAATKYSRLMVAQDFFSHVSPSGSTMSARIKASGYLKGGRSYRFGENLAWGTGDLGSPVEIVNTWMHSPGHRANILQPAYREVGVGVALGAPGRDEGATYTTEFGVKG